MVHHVVAMLSIVLGVSADWLGAPREESSTPLRDAWHAHGLISVAGGVLGALLLWRLPPLALRLSPIWVSLLLAVPLDAALSSTVLGTRLRARRWLLTPAETMPSAILERAAELTSQRQDGDASLAERFERFVRDPWLNELHVALLRSSGRRLRPRAVVEKIAARVSVEGLAGLSRKETLVLLSDTWAIRTLHERHFCAAARPPPEADGEASSSAPQGSAESTTEHGEAHPSTE
jgi:membrane glycosyltransferase